MAKKKLGKLAQARKDYYDLVVEFRVAYAKCIDAGIHISPENIVEKAKWRIVIEFKTKEGKVKESVASDGFTKPEDLSKNRVYLTKEAYEIKIMELYIFYAKTL